MVSPWDFGRWFPRVVLHHSGGAAVLAWVVGIRGRLVQKRELDRNKHTRECTTRARLVLPLSSSDSSDLTSMVMVAAD